MKIRRLVTGQRWVVVRFLALAVLCLSAPAAFAQQGVVGAKWSPDGDLIAFSAIGDGDDWEIFVIRPDGTDLRQLTKNDFTDIQPAFSHDGQSIYFSSMMARDGKKGSDWDISSVGLGGGTPVHMFGEPGYSDYHTAALPDGRFAFSQRRLGDAYDSDLRVWAPETGRISYLSDEAPILQRTGNFEIRVAAPLVGETIFFNSRRNGHHEIFSVSLNGGEAEQITASWRTDPDRWLGHAAPSVSADGRFLAVWTDQSAPAPAGSPTSYITHMVLDRETGEVRELPKTNQRAFLGYPGLSPDGSQVAFASAVGNDPTSLWALYVQDVATGEARELWRQTRSSKQ